MVAQRLASAIQPKIGGVPRSAIGAGARRRRHLGRHALVSVASLWFFALVLVLWWVLSANSHSLYFPPLHAIVQRLGQLWIFADVPNYLAPSLLHFVIGYTIAAVLGVGLGTLFFALPAVRDATSPVVYFLYVLPAPVLVPAALVLFGIGGSMSIAIISFACLWPVLLNTVDGMRSTDPLKLDTARSLGLSYKRSLWSVVLPGAAPQIAAGLRAGLQVGIVLMVVSEEVGSTNGIGFFIIQAQENFALTDMWTGIIVLGIVGTVINVAFVLGERVVLRWYYGARAAARAR